MIPESSDAANRALNEVAERSAYGPQFWTTFAANSCTSISVSLLFRYKDFVASIGGGELELGWIVGLGMVGSVLMRLWQGVGIDRYGSRFMWIVSSLGIVLSCLGHTFIAEGNLTGAYVLRICYQISVSGFFGATITYISARSPVIRVAEVVGMLGASGFVGMMIGTQLSDWLLGADDIVDRAAINQVFMLSAAMGVVGLLLGIRASCDQPPQRKRRHPPWWAILRRYHPGVIVLVGSATSFGLSLPTVFLRPYLETVGIGGIALFFTPYLIVALIARVAARQFPERYGIHAMVLVGLASLVLSILFFLLVSSTWHLLLPAFFMGVAHAVLFPAVVAGGSGAFPTRYRGVGTTWVLAMFDVGALVGMPAAGSLLNAAQTHGWPPYPTLFISVAAVLALIGLVYLLLRDPTREEAWHGPA